MFQLTCFNINIDEDKKRHFKVVININKGNLF